MLRVVIDTNVIVSAIAFGGPPRDVMNLGVTGHMRMFISDAIIEELRDVLRRPKFGYDWKVVRAIVHELEMAADYVDSVPPVDLVSRDPDDNRIVACAVSARAQYLITGDNDLLSLVSDDLDFGIVSPSRFLELFWSSARRC